ncbi:hypothetical protein E4U17_001653 [Claviceps sp. LM77 group G4]|nr:hypothetical protein E4U17_001653 [Claviceps sp. LM77 group G4]
MIGIWGLSPIEPSYLTDRDMFKHKKTFQSTQFDRNPQLKMELIEKVVGNAGPACRMGHWQHASPSHRVTESPSSSSDRLKSWYNNYRWSH